MSSPFQEKFSAKSPFGKKGVVTLSEEDLKKIKSASSEPAKEISYEGQGGKDYENRPEDAINPEGQGGIDYESKDYKKKTESVVQMKSPLNSYASGGRGEVYLSNIDLIQNAANAVATAAMDIDNASAESKANRQEKRVERREKRRGEKENFNEDSLAKFDAKTKKISDKASKNRTTASEEKEAKRKRDYDIMTDEAYKKKYGVDKSSTNSNKTSNIFKNYIK